MFELLLGLGVVALALWFTTRGKAAKAANDPEFAAFSQKYVASLVCGLTCEYALAAHAYVLYRKHGLTGAEVIRANLCGLFAHALTASYVKLLERGLGLRTSCIGCFCLYAAAAVLGGSSAYMDASRYYYYIFASRLLAGAASAVLMSSFDGWMRSEHSTRGHAPQLMGLTYAKAAQASTYCSLGTGLFCDLGRHFSGSDAFACDASLLLSLVGVIMLLREQQSTSPKSTADYGVCPPRPTALASKAALYTTIAATSFDAVAKASTAVWAPVMWRAAVARGETAPPMGAVFSVLMASAVVGRKCFEAVFSRKVLGLEQLAVAVCVVAAVAKAALGATHVDDEPGLLILAGFSLFQISLGASQPTFGVLRGRNVPAVSRAAVTRSATLAAALAASLLLFQYDPEAPTRFFALSATTLLCAAAASAALHASSNTIENTKKPQQPQPVQPQEAA